MFEAPAGTTYRVELAVKEDGLTAFLLPVLDIVRRFRGGPGLIAELCDGHGETEAIDRAIMNDELWRIADDEATVGVVVVRRGVLLGIYVDEVRRRQGVARATIAVLRNAGVDITDARALPGDRATKSLFESLGWKARLLTMSPTQ
jgi:GNAT superfamily N-acetyltransferase